MSETQTAPLDSETNIQEPSASDDASSTVLPVTQDALKCKQDKSGRWHVELRIHISTPSLDVIRRAVAMKSLRLIVDKTVQLGDHREAVGRPQIILVRFGGMRWKDWKLEAALGITFEQLDELHLNVSDLAHAELKLDCTVTELDLWRVIDGESRDAQGTLGLLGSDDTDDEEGNDE